MEIASHNSWTFQKPEHFWMRPMQLVAKCQQYNIASQWTGGIRCFDLRVRFFPDGMPYFCHGLVEYPGNVSMELMALDRLAEKDHTLAYCRVMFEDNVRMRDRDAQVNSFVRFCDYVNNHREFSHIIFFGGWSKSGWTDDMLYDFKTPEPRLRECHASVSGSVPKKWFPQWFAKTKTTLILKSYAACCGEDGYFMTDFI